MRRVLARAFGSLLPLFLIHTSTTSATDAAPLRPLFTAPRAVAPPVIDGELDDPCWQRSARVSYFMTARPRRLAQRQTWTYVCWDSDSLYLAFRCEDPQVGRLSAHAADKDSPALLQDDYVEVHLAPSGEHARFYHLMVNGDGTVYDESEPGDPASWDPDLKIGVSRGSNYWTVELAVEGQEVDRRNPGTSEWGINFGRHATHPEELSRWYPSEDSPGSRQLGRMRLETAAPIAQLVALGDAFGDLGKEGAVASIALVNPTSGKLACEIGARTREPSTKWTEAGPRKIALPPSSQQTVAAPYSVSQPKGNLLHVLVKQNGTITFDSGELPLKDRFLRPRLEGALRRLQSGLSTVTSSKSILPEVRQLREQLGANLQVVNRLSQSVDAPSPPSAGRWLEVDRKLREIEESLHEADITLIILSGYTSAELQGKSMNRQYVIYTRPVFEVAAPDSKPEKHEIRQSLAVFATPGETEPASFCVCSRISLENVTVKASDLTRVSAPSQADTIPAQPTDRNRLKQAFIPARCVNIKVLKYWWQGGTAVEKGPNLVLVPELLVKDDRVSMRGLAPDVPVRVDPLTDIPAGSSKQFWITISVPAEAEPGDYQSTLTFLPPGQPVSRLTLRLRVLPFALPQPRQRLLMEYRHRLELGSGINTVTESRFQMELRDIADHGFHAATVFDSGSSRDQALTLQQKVGMTGPIPVVEGSREPRDLRPLLKRQKRVKGAPLLFYVPEPVKTPAELEGGRGRLSAIRAAGGTTVAVTSPGRTSELHDVLDVPCFDVTDPGFVEYVRDRLANSAGSAVDTHCYTWEAMQENPSVNRLFCGYYLWKTGVFGGLARTYQEVLSGDDPYNDNSGVRLRHRMVTYPSRQGPVTTIQWEAAREGIDDLRYLTQLELLIRAHENLKRPALQSAVVEGKKTLDKARRSIQADYRVTLKSLRPRDYQSLRWQVAQAIMKIMDAMRK
ncbi:MAG: hypothetical protein HY318_08950 [Armatimonadetes bacterium]|nr:hypothetical protein [Armatimonadota bacterium]